MARMQYIWLLGFLLILVFCPVSASRGQGPESNGSKAAAPTVAIPEGTGQAILEQASEAKAQLERQVRGIYEREPLGFDLKTLGHVSDSVFNLPVLVSGLLQALHEQGKMLGLLGSILILMFLAVLFSSLFGMPKILEHLSQMASPLMTKASEPYQSLLRTVLGVVAATLIPLLLYGIFDLILAFTGYNASWFLLTGKLLTLWALGALTFSLLHAILLSDLIPLPREHALSIYRLSRVIALYVLISIAVVWVAQAFRVSKEILALTRFLISVSIVLAVFLLLLKKESMMGLLPALPYKVYRFLLNMLDRLYYPIAILTLLSGIFWCFGYKRLAEFIWIRTWGVAGTFFFATIAYHIALNGVRIRILSPAPLNRTAGAFYRAWHHCLLFSFVASTLAVSLELLGILEPLRGILSFPLLVIGQESISLWSIGKASLMFAALLLGFRVLRSYLALKVYPAIGIEEGLAYSLNTLLGYLLISIAILASLNTLGINLQLLMVMGGAIGIGVGFGLKEFAANLLSGLSLIFGRKVRKNDWIQIGDTLGYVEAVGLGVTRLKTRDNIEYVIPNSVLTTSTIINFTLSEPYVRIHIPIGVSYDSNPNEVRAMLERIAKSSDSLSSHREPNVWFTEYGESSLNFELLVWIDVRVISAKDAQSRLYFEIFQAFSEAGIEIPFPQRVVRFKPTPESPVLREPSAVCQATEDLNPASARRGD